jgi:DNA-binding NtrC family response regulator
MLVDCDNSTVSLLRDVFDAQGYAVSTFADTRSGLNTLLSEAESVFPIELILCDLALAEADHYAFIRSVIEHKPGVPVVVLASTSQEDSTLEALRAGALGVVTKPLKLAELLLGVERGFEWGRTQRELTMLRKQVKGAWGFGDFLGKSSAIQRLTDKARKVAASHANILFYGEPGTGKELLARVIHHSGPRAAKPFVVLDCSSLPETLLEEALFGSSGLVEAAREGVLFLDEVGTLPGSTQARLLRTDPHLRLFCASQRDLRPDVRLGRFRADLYFRLAVVPLTIPPLRERVIDIPLLAQNFLERHLMDCGDSPSSRKFTSEALAKLCRRQWNGNVRELENLIARVAVLSNEERISAESIPEGEMGSVADPEEICTEGFPTLSQLEERYVRAILERVDGKKDRAARALGINRRTLLRKERQFGWIPDGQSEEDWSNEAAPLRPPPIAQSPLSEKSALDEP